jgi:DNA-binding response OmpR family regulator
MKSASKTSQPEKEAAKPLPPESNPPRRILVVEDDAESRRRNTEVLAQFGYHVDTATDGAAAWDALQADNYHLVVTDNTMPKVTGVELLKKLHAARMALPVIMATSALPDEDFTRCPWLLPAAVLIKPYSLPELVDTVQAVLRAAGDVPQPVAPPGWLSQLPPEDWQLY